MGAKTPTLQHGPRLADDLAYRTEARKTPHQRVARPRTEGLDNMAQSRHGGWLFQKRGVALAVTQWHPVPKALNRAKHQPAAQRLIVAIAGLRYVKQFSPLAPSDAL